MTRQIPLSINGRHFCDSDGRTTILRGINLAGISVLPHPDGATHIKTSWPPMDLKDISWVDRPFPLDECDEHFSRLRSWGFNCIRLLTSWEAIEHEGPYIYDEEYLDYFAAIVKKAGDYGFYVFVNFHQDVWSRVTGGDGHPLWTFDKVGMDYTTFDKADAAHNMQYLWDEDPKKNLYLNWNENDRLFPVKTMWTLFWAGEDFAPKITLEDEITGDIVNIGEYLRRHFLKSIEQVALRVKDFPHVFGFNPLNEPSTGYIGRFVGKKVLKYDKNKLDENPDLGLNWTPLDT
ncbi:MAG: cellulase family glycosylhydrolase, partial [Promethearchaeota archaeon]